MRSYQKLYRFLKGLYEAPLGEKKAGRIVQYEVYPPSKA